ncbi:head-tail connector protein [Novosphingobium sp. fls2-241-R2A-195]|uniref:head-tail connector protein n=1 Tax=Novosphingobium sp. fls2-241-R2A-195 TaxID=3040296 RepID=UPI00254B5327|nr:head-tail connector protein [Novosphingobium sp. fls2-241-R2A-195]
MRVFVVTPPEPVISLAEAKDHLRVDGLDEDALISGYVAAACAHIDGPDGWLGRALGVQTLEIRYPAFGTCGWLLLPFPPAIEAVSVEYVDSNGAEVTLDDGQYELSGNMLRPAWSTSWPTAAWRGAAGETVRIRWSAGYETLPAPIRAAILLMVGDLYAHRETAVTGIGAARIPMSMTIENLLSPFRVFA